MLTDTDEEFPAPLTISASPRIVAFMNCPLIACNLPHLDMIRTVSNSPMGRIVDINFPLNESFDLEKGVSVEAFWPGFGGTLNDNRGCIRSTAWFDKNSSPLKLKRLLIGLPSSPMSDITYEQPVKLGSASVPKVIRCIEYQNKKPYTQITYILIKAEPKSLPVASFNIRTYLSNRQAVYIETNGKINAYTYDPKFKGDLMDLPKYQEQEQQNRFAELDKTNTTLIAAATKAGGTPTAQKLFDEACSKAKVENKKVMLIFHSTWCGPCKRLEAFLNRLKVKPIIDRHFVVLYLDEFEGGKSTVLNNVGARDLMKKYGGENCGIPYYAIVDADGKLVVDGKKTNGMPENDDDFKTYNAFLKQGDTSITEEELTTITNAFRNPVYKITASVNPVHAKPGANVTATVTVKCNETPLDKGIVDIELHTKDDYSKVSQQSTDGQRMRVGDTKTYTWTFKAPKEAKNYQITAGVFDKNWANVRTFDWNLAELIVK